MASTIFFTTPSHNDNLVVDSVSSSGSNIDKYFTIDQNLKTKWTPTGYNDEHIIIDTHLDAQKGTITSGSVDGYAIVINNYNTDFSAGRIRVSGSHDKVTWTTLSSHAIDPNGDIGGLLFNDFDSANQAYRFYEFHLTHFSASIDIGQVMITKKRETWRPHYTMQDSIQFENSVSKLNGFDEVVSAKANNHITIFTRKFQLIDPHKTVIDNAYKDSQGRLRWLIYKGDDTFPEGVLAKFVDDAAKSTIVNKGLWTVAFKLKTIAFVEDGEDI